MSVTMKDSKGILLAIVLALTSVATAGENGHSNSAREDREFSMIAYVVGLRSCRVTRGFLSGNGFR